MGEQESGRAATVVRLGPELHLAQVRDTKPQLLEALRTRVAAEPLSLDCSRLHSVDAAGLQLLVTLSMALRDRGAGLRLLACQPEVRQRIDSVALHGWFEFALPEAA